MTGVNTAVINHPAITNAMQPVAHFVPGGSPHIEIIVAQTGRTAPTIKTIKPTQKKLNRPLFRNTRTDNTTCSAGRKY